MFYPLPRGNGTVTALILPFPKFRQCQCGSLEKIIPSRKRTFQCFCGCKLLFLASYLDRKIIAAEGKYKFREITVLAESV